MSDTKELIQKPNNKLTPKSFVNTVVHEYRGITWTSDMGLSIKLGKTNSYVSGNLKKGKSYEQIIDYCLDKSKTYRGVTWISHKDLCEKLGKNDSYVYVNLKKGKSYEQIIDYCLDYIPPTQRTQRTYRGISWTSNRNLSKKLGKAQSYVYVNLKMGKSYEDIIDYVLDNPASGPKTYRDITWTSNMDLSRKLGMNNSYVSGNIKKGKSYEQIIDYVLDNSKKSI